MKKVVLAICFGTLSGTASAGLFGPSNYDECVLENLKGVGSDVGARMVAVACEKQFPAKKPVEKAAQQAAPVSSTTPVLPAEGDRAKLGSKKTGVLDFDDLLPEPAK